jgi:mannose-6-phosphate isomerase-like protein (cupin superfamily)
MLHYTNSAVDIAKWTKRKNNSENKFWNNWNSILDENNKQNAKLQMNTDEYRRKLHERTNSCEVVY